MAEQHCFVLSLLHVPQIGSVQFDGALLRNNTTNTHTHNMHTHLHFPELTVNFV